MLELFTTGKVIDVALSVIVLEGIALWVWRRRSGWGLPLVDLVGHLLAGACLLLALRFATHRDVNPMGMLFLTAALPAHLFDLWRRLETHRRFRTAP